MKKSAFCISRTDAQTAEIVSRLKQAGFSADDVSILIADKAGIRDLTTTKATKSPEGASAGVAVGGVLGGALGWLVGIGTLAIPGVGPFIAAGPLLAALSGAAVGATVGGLTGALVGMGIPEYEAKVYEGKIRGGSSLIAVHCDTSEQIKMAKEVFEKCGGTDISSSSEASTPNRREDSHVEIETRPIGTPQHTKYS
jgi:hypothetical protein